MHYTVQCNGESMLHPSTTKNVPTHRGASRDAIVNAAERLFMEQGFDGVSMDQLAENAGVARRTLYNQFAGKEDIFREVLSRLSGQIGAFLPPGIETQGEVEDVLRLIAKAVLTFQSSPRFIGLIRMAVADARQFPWIAGAFAAVLDPHLERLARYLSYLTSLGILDCPHPLLAAHQFLGLLNEPILWQRILSREVVPVSPKTVGEEAVQMFLLRYRAKPAPIGPG